MSSRLQISILVAGVLAVAVSAYATDEAVLDSFLGGDLELNFSAASQLLSGPGVSAASTVHATCSRPDPFAVFANPASWTMVRHGAAIGVSVQPHLSINSIPGSVQSAVDNSIDNTLSGFRASRNVDYPTLTGTLARSTNLVSGIGVILPAGKWRIGLGYARPVSADLNVEHSGLNQSIRQVDGSPGNTVDFDIQSRLAMTASLSSERWLAGAGREFGPFSVGASFSRTDIEFSVDGGYQVNGSVTYQDETHYFNDETDPWYNRFQGLARGGYSGSIYGAQAGMNWRLGANPETAWTVSAAASLNFNASLHGSMEVALDEYLPLELNPGDGEAAFDIERVEDAGQITRTHENQYYPANEVTIELPSSFSLGVAKSNGLRPNLSVTAYTGHLAYRVDVSEKRVMDEEYTKNTYSRGITPLGSVYLGISPGVFFLGGGVSYALDFVEGYRGTEDTGPTGGAPIYIPRFDLGMIIPINTHLRSEILFVGLPEDALRLGFTYQF